MSEDAPSLMSSSFRASRMLVAAAVGDALGWPQEDRAHRTDASGPSSTGDFRSWVRRTGGRFFSHEEAIAAGEYSDDTQLLLCTARSILRGECWHERWSNVELPTWTLYERGGGSATIRAANCWLAGRAPWAQTGDQKAIERYFEAGGNGAAMRILPHAIAGHRDTDFSRIRRAIIANGISTHGHPRALIGALAYGFVAWTTIRLTGTLKFGQLVEAALDGTSAWGELPEAPTVPTDWCQTADGTTTGGYARLWNEAVEEMQQLFRTCIEGVSRGALAVDSEVLADLGSFDRRMRGAGTVATAASVFLASRHAADPIHGLLSAAYATDADTDTLASMAAALLGGLHGDDWLRDHVVKLQDSRYILSVADELVAGKLNSDVEERPEATVTRRDIDVVREMLDSAQPFSVVDLPDGRKATVAARPALLKPRSGSTRVYRWQLHISDGQSIYVKKFGRVPKSQESRSATSNGTPQQASFDTVPMETLARVTRAGVRLPVGNLAESRAFYVETLGLRVAKEGPDLINLEGVIALVSPSAAEPKRHERVAQLGMSVYVETLAFEEVLSRVRASQPSVRVERSADGREILRCKDPDGYTVRIFRAH